MYHVEARHLTKTQEHCLVAGVTQIFQGKTSSETECLPTHNLQKSDEDDSVLFHICNISSGTISKRSFRATRTTS